MSMKYCADYYKVFDLFSKCIRYCIAQKYLRNKYVIVKGVNKTFIIFS